MGRCSGQAPRDLGGCANYPMDPLALHIYQNTSEAQHKAKTPKPPQKSYYSPSSHMSTGLLMAVYIIIILT